MPMLHEMEIWLQIKLAGSRARPIDCGRVTNLSVRPEQSVHRGCIRGRASCDARGRVARLS